MTKLKTKADPFERYTSQPVTTTRRYSVPVSVIKAIRKLTPVYGSQGRALQVGTEHLIRLIAINRKLKLKDVPDCEHVYLTYKILPRTVDLIDRLYKVYGSHAAVFCAVLEVLRQSENDGA